MRSLALSRDRPTGFTIGTLAAILDIWHYWMADLRLGYCTTGWALNKQFCCWGAGASHRAARTLARRGVLTPAGTRNRDRTGDVAGHSPRAEEGSCAQWHMWSGADQDGNNFNFYEIEYITNMFFDN